MEVFKKLTIPSGKQLRVNKLPEYSKANITGKVYDLNGNLLYDSSAPVGSNVVTQARRLIGLSYVQDGTYNYLSSAIPPHVDCSSLCQWSYYNATPSITLSRTTYTQINEGVEVSLSDLRPGDLVFTNFSSPGVPEHVYLYSKYEGGQHWCVEAAYPGTTVRERVFSIGESGSMRARRVM